MGFSQTGLTSQRFIRESWQKLYGPDWRDSATRYEDRHEKWLDAFEEDDAQPPDFTEYLVEASPREREASPFVGFRTPSGPAASAVGPVGGVSSLLSPGQNDENSSIGSGEFPTETEVINVLYTDYDPDSDDYEEYKLKMERALSVASATKN